MRVSVRFRARFGFKVRVVGRCHKLVRVRVRVKVRARVGTNLERPVDRGVVGGAAVAHGRQRGAQAQGQRGQQRVGSL